MADPQGPRLVLAWSHLSRLPQHFNLYSHGHSHIELRRDSKRLKTHSKLFVAPCPHCPEAKDGQALPDLYKGGGDNHDVSSFSFGIWNPFCSLFCYTLLICALISWRRSSNLVDLDLHLLRLRSGVLRIGSKTGFNQVPGPVQASRSGTSPFRKMMSTGRHLNAVRPCRCLPFQAWKSLARQSFYDSGEAMQRRVRARSTNESCQSTSHSESPYRRGLGRFQLGRALKVRERYTFLHQKGPEAHQTHTRDTPRAKDVASSLRGSHRTTLCHGQE
eukprot:s792_g12.t1